MLFRSIGSGNTHFTGDASTYYYYLKGLDLEELKNKRDETSLYYSGDKAAIYQKYLMKLLYKLNIRDAQFNPEVDFIWGILYKIWTEVSKKYLVFHYQITTEHSESWWVDNFHYITEAIAELTEEELKIEWEETEEVIEEEEITEEEEIIEEVEYVEEEEEEVVAVFILV